MNLLNDFRTITWNPDNLCCPWRAVIPLLIHTRPPCTFLPLEKIIQEVVLTYSSGWIQFQFTSVFFMLKGLYHVLRNKTLHWWVLKAWLSRLTFPNPLYCWSRLPYVTLSKGDLNQPGQAVRSCSPKHVTETRKRVFVVSSF